MSDHVRYVDKRGLAKIFPTSDSTRYRLMNHPADPFPKGKLIGGKRYWSVPEVLDWLDRQDAEPVPVYTNSEIAVDKRGAQAVAT